MTYHRASDELLCHICGAIRKMPEACPNEECRDKSFKFSGFGTQRVEVVVAKCFPHARVRRMDSDTTKNKGSHATILGDFRTGKIDILVGTQMIAKGLHFPNVTLVGVLFADMSLHMPDFRAAERTFQLITQVAGRAGRGEIPGEVIVQTFTPYHPAITSARELDFERFYDQEIEFRRELVYPPFSRVVCITLRGVREPLVKLTAEHFMKALKSCASPQVTMGEPTPAPLARAKGEYRYQIILRAALTKLMSEPLRKVMKDFKWPEGVKCSVDVDALSLL